MKTDTESATQQLSVGLGSTAPAVFSEDWSGLTDDALQLKYETADAMQGMAFLLKCKAIHAYRENHVQSWGTSWVDQAIERFNVSRRYCEAFSNIWEICVNRDAYFELVAPLTDSRSLMQFIGRKKPEDGDAAMAAAVAHYAQYNEPPTVAALAEKLGQESSALPDLYSCPDCNFTAQLVGFKRIGLTGAAAKRARYAQPIEMFEMFTCPECAHKGERPVFQLAQAEPSVKE